MEAKALQDSGFEAPNLDGLSLNPDDLKEAATLFRRLAKYADHKARAMELRLRGNIPVALLFEAKADAVYKRLPTWARW